MAGVLINRRAWASGLADWAILRMRSMTPGASMMVLPISLTPAPSRSSHSTADAPCVMAVSASAAGMSASASSSSAPKLRRYKIYN